MTPWSLSVGGAEILLSGRLLLGFCLLAAGFAKAVNVSEFKSGMRQYNLVPPKLVPHVTAAVLAAELLIGAALTLGFLTAWVAGIAAAMLSGFSGAVLLQLVRGNDIPCGCFGNILPGETVSWVTLARNAVLIGLAISLVLAGHGGSYGLDGLVLPGIVTPETPDANALPSIFLSLFGISFYVLSSEVAAFLRSPNLPSRVNDEAREGGGRGV